MTLKSFNPQWNPPTLIEFMIWEDSYKWNSSDERTAVAMSMWIKSAQSNLHSIIWTLENQQRQESRNPISMQERRDEQKNLHEENKWKKKSFLI